MAADRAGRCSITATIMATTIRAAAPWCARCRVAYGRITTTAAASTSPAAPGMRPDRRHFRYFGVPGNKLLAHFRFTVSHFWHRALERRSQNGRVQWERMQRLIRRWFLRPISAIPILRAVCASPPEARAGCGKSARPDRGGYGVIRIPTATPHHPMRSSAGFRRVHHGCRSGPQEQASRPEGGLRFYCGIEMPETSEGLG